VFALQILKKIEANFMFEGKGQEKEDDSSKCNSTS
jgi:hypothetical protein